MKVNSFKHLVDQLPEEQMDYNIVVSVSEVGEDCLHCYVNEEKKTLTIMNYKETFYSITGKD